MRKEIDTSPPLIRILFTILLILVFFIWENNNAWTILTIVISIVNEIYSYNLLHNRLLIRRLRQSNEAKVKYIDKLVQNI